MRAVTPTGDLILELLGSRFRQGYQTWPIEHRHEKALSILEDRGLIWRRDVDGRIFDVWLTPKGEKRVIDPDHKSPIQKERDDLRKKFDDLQDLYNDLAARSAR